VKESRSFYAEPLGNQVIFKVDHEHAQGLYLAIKETV